MTTKEYIDLLDRLATIYDRDPAFIPYPVLKNDSMDNEVYIEVTHDTIDQ
jgi:hypothetical protein